MRFSTALKTLILALGLILPVAAPGQESGTPAAAAGFAKISNPDLGFGLMGVHDWSPEQPFLDVMKTARPWIGHRPGEWGGMDEAGLRAAGVLDDEGWPRRIPEGLGSIGTLFLTDLPGGAVDMAGRYLVLWEGQGQIEMHGAARDIAPEAGGLGFSYSPGEGMVDFRITAIDAQDPIRRIRVVKAARADLLAQGEIFNPDFLARMEGTKLLRFMDWMATNNARLSAPQDRPLASDYTWAGEAGVPLEVAISLANRLQADPWITVPHLASDALVREMAAVVARDLDPELKLWAEFSNEVWNWQFDQARWADEQAKARWGEGGAWVSYYALRAAEVMALWSEALPPERLVRVIATQTGWRGLEEQILDPEPIRKEGGAPPYESFDAYAITGYFQGKLGYEDRDALIRSWLAQSRAEARDQAGALGLTGAPLEAWVSRHGFALAGELAESELRDGALSGEFEESLGFVTGTLFPYHARVAAGHDLALVMYEGGTHVTPIGPVMEDAEMVQFFTELNYSPGMGRLYTELLEGWKAVSDAPFLHYGSVFTPGKYGSWGALRHLSDDNPRWQALIGCSPC
ncbi:hypothetical protein [Pseudogemmobacter faecipullorum]|uniref:Cellulose-binding protein n=1 Tax=Pseudogemmobacter faecipullorum TaxID=2755041 RepID=A0ABS8CGS0_9RHOB|nr:hypothetical protein [Pseudogemmobacter faecipullorum]MCB5408591.1 hypothetical protein [Pseudogemmobacter faecipullorum]